MPNVISKKMAIIDQKKGNNNNIKKKKKKKKTMTANIAERNARCARMQHKGKEEEEEFARISSSWLVSE